MMLQLKSFLTDGTSKEPPARMLELMMHLQRMGVFESRLATVALEWTFGTVNFQMSCQETLASKGLETLVAGEGVHFIDHFSTAF